MLPIRRYTSCLQFRLLYLGSGQFCLHAKLNVDQLLRRSWFANLGWCRRIQRGIAAAIARSVGPQPLLHGDLGCPTVRLVVVQFLLIQIRQNKHLPTMDPFARVVCHEWKRKAFIVGVIVVYADHDLLQSGLAY